MSVFQDLAYMQFGRLMALDYLGSGQWRCVCECGKYTVVQGRHLRSRHTKTCGQCYRPIRTHGLSKTVEYKTWIAMISRCTNPKTAEYHNYGGRGITVCEQWIHDFPAFYAHVGQRPSPMHSLDRFPDKNGDYKPGNVRWATPSQQQNNKRTNRLITFNGITLTLRDWARKLNINEATLFHRLKRGWSVEEALTFPMLRISINEARENK